MTNNEAEKLEESYTQSNIDRMRKLMEYIDDKSVIHALDYGSVPFKGRVQEDKDVTGIELERLLSLLHARINIWLENKKDTVLSPQMLKEFRVMITNV